MDEPELRKRKNDGLVKYVKNRRIKDNPMTHMTCSKYPRYCHTHPLCYPIRWAYTPNSSLEQKSNGSSNHDWSRGHPSLTLTLPYEQRSYKNP